METLLDDAPVTQIVHAPAATTMPTAPAPAKPAAPEKPLFNTMADRLTSLLAEAKTTATPDKPQEPPVQPQKEPVKEGVEPTAKDATWTSKKAEEWKALKTRMSEIETKSKNMSELLKAKDTEIETLKKQPVIDPKELETLKGERDTLNSKLEKVALEQSPRFQQHYQKMFDKAVALAKDAAGTEHAELAEHLLQLKPSAKRKAQLDEITSSLTSETDKQNLTAAFRAMDDARSERDEALNNSKEQLTKLATVEAAERNRQSELQKGQRKEKIEKALSIASSLEAFSLIEGQDEHNNRIPARQDRVRKALLGELPENELMLMPMLAEEATYLKETLLPKMISKMKEMDASIAQLSGVQPSPTGNGELPKPGAEKKSDGVGFIDHFNQLYRGPSRKQA